MRSLPSQQMHRVGWQSMQPARGLITSMYEIPVLAIVNEVYFRMAYDYDVLLKQFKRRLDEKVRLLEEDTYRLSDFSEFGLRRRLSAEAPGDGCKGTRRG